MRPVMENRRVPLVFALAAAIVLAPVLVPEHTHDGDAARATTHRHFAFHDAPSAGHARERFDHPDQDHVTWLATVGIETATHEAPLRVAIVAAAPALAHRTGTRPALPLDDVAPPHGPPRSTTQLRAPPASRLI